MRALGSTGVWELFVPGIGPGSCTSSGARRRRRRRDKADPMAFATEVPPATASVVTPSPTMDRRRVAGGPRRDGADTSRR